jgi:hypothetical protein
MALRGGAGSLVCYKGGETCYEHQVTHCIWSTDICAIYCPGYDDYECTDI